MSNLPYYSNPSYYSGLESIPIIEEDHLTGLDCTWLFWGYQGSCGIVLNEPNGLYLRYFNTCQGWKC